MTKKHYNLCGALVTAAIISACVPVGGTGSGGNPTPTVLPSPTNSPTPVAAWGYVGGIPGISESEADYISLAINRQTGAMAVGFQDQAASGKLSVLGIPLNGSNWSYLGGQGISPGVANYVNLKISPNGVMYAAFKNIPTPGSGESGGYAYVYHYNNTGWDYPTISGIIDPASISVANNIALAVPQNNVPYVLYSLGVPSTVENAYLGLSFRDTGGWIKRTFSPAITSDNQIEFVPNISNNEMYIAFKDGLSNNSISVYSLQESYTTPVAVGSRGFTYHDVYFVSLAVNSSGIPYVAFEDAAYNDKLSVMYYNGAGGWQYVGGSPGISAGKAVYVSLMLDLNGNPYVAYQDLSTGMNGKLVIQRYINNKWSVIAQGISIGQANYISLKNNPLTNKPVVAFQDVGLGNLLSVMQYTGQ